MKFSMYRCIWVAILAVFFGSAGLAFGQVTNGSLTGQVTDPTGAAVVGASIAMTNTQTGLVLTGTTNKQGVYTISPVNPGTYNLTAEMSGFQRYQQTGIIISVSLAATQNITLKPGSAKETVTVSADAELVNTTSAELGTTINSTEITQLPLNGRDPSALVFLAPGMTAGGGQPGVQSGFSFPSETGASANGGRQGSTYYLLDGVPNMDNYTGLSAPFPNPDATQEFRVITNNFNAEYGFAPGAVVSIETRSGTNKFHGGAFEFLRDKVMNASGGYFSGVRSPDPLHRNQYGAYVGGPIMKNKLFLFLNYQATRQSTAALSNSTFTPTAAMLNGDFSAIPTTLCPPGARNTPAGCPFKTVNGKANQVDPALFSPASVTITKTGLPLGQAGTPGLVFYPGAPTINNLDEGTARLDYDISSTQRVQLRSYINNLIQPSGDIPGNILSVLNLSPWSQSFGERMEYYNEALSHVWTISPTAVNTASLFWTEMSAHNSSAVKDSSGQNMCWSRYINVTELPGQCYMEGFSVGNGGFNGGWTEPSQEVRITFGLYDNFTKTLNKHTLDFGLNLQHQRAGELTQYPTQPIINYNGQYTGNGLADFLMGYMYNYQQGAGEIAQMAGWQPGLYVQDQYRAKPNLSLTAGLRWDPNIAPQVAGGRGSAFVPGQKSVMYPNAPTGLVFPGDKGISKALMPNSYGYYQPRVGLAWQPSMLKNTSVRAGFGLFTGPLQLSVYNHTSDISPFSPYFNLQGGVNTPLNNSDPWSTNAGTNYKSPFPPFTSVSYVPPSTATFAPPFEIPAVFSQRFKLGMTESWNLSLQRQIRQNMVFELAYVGTQSYHQQFVIDQNPGVFANKGARSAFQDFTSILKLRSDGTASYHALQASFTERLWHGLQFQSNFTWSKTMDLASSGNVSFGNPALSNPFNIPYNYGLSSINIPLVWVSSVVYTTPTLEGRSQLVRQVLGGWEVSAIITSESGGPFTVSGGNGNNNSLSQQGGDRADVVPGANFDVRQGGKSRWLNHYFNTAAFKTNTPGTFGDSGRNIMNAPPVNTMDTNFAKNWAIHEGYNLQFRWEMYNALNHPSFSGPDANVTDGNFGKITSLGGIPPRVMQLAAKFTF